MTAKRATTPNPPAACDSRDYSVATLRVVSSSSSRRARRGVPSWLRFGGVLRTADLVVPMPTAEGLGKIAGVLGVQRVELIDADGDRLVADINETSTDELQEAGLTSVEARFVAAVGKALVGYTPPVREIRKYEPVR